MRNLLALKSEMEKRQTLLRDECTTLKDRLDVMRVVSPVHARATTPRAPAASNPAAAVLEVCAHMPVAGCHANEEDSRLCVLVFPAVCRQAEIEHTEERLHTLQREQLDLLQSKERVIAELRTYTAVSPSPAVCCVWIVSVAVLMSLLGGISCA